MAIKVSRCDGIGQVLTATILELQAGQVADILAAAVKTDGLEVVTAAMNVNDPRFQQAVKMLQKVFQENTVLQKFPEEAQKAGLIKHLKTQAPALMRGMDADTLQSIFDAVKGRPIVNLPRQAPAEQEQFHTPSGQEGKIMQSWHDQPDSPIMMRNRGIIPRA